MWKGKSKIGACTKRVPACFTGITRQFESKQLNCKVLVIDCWLVGMAAEIPAGLGLLETSSLNSFKRFIFMGMDSLENPYQISDLGLVR